MNENKHLVIGAATGYKKKDLYNFIESLRKVYTQEIILIINKKIDKETILYFNSRNIKTYVTKKTSRTIFKDRYKIYLDIIQNNKNIEKVMVTDTKDVIFQINPFENHLFDKINFFLEDKYIFECPTNSRWLIRSYGKKVYEKLKKNSISCSGVTLGERDSMIQYCSKMVWEIKHNIYFTLNFFNKGSDQGKNNFLINQPEFNYAKLFKNIDCFVVNLSNSKPDIIDYKNKTFSINNKKISVIHQYNSHKIINDFVDDYINSIV